MRTIMIDNQKVKEILFGLGADLCGIAGIDRFDDAPEGYHPTDVLPTCRSVISFACRFPIGTLRCNSPVPYTRVRNSITAKMDAIALDFCMEMEKYQAVCVPIPTNESQWDEKQKDGAPLFLKSTRHRRQVWGRSGGILCSSRRNLAVWFGWERFCASRNWNVTS